MMAGWAENNACWRLYSSVRWSDNDVCFDFVSDILNLFENDEN
jgi:hypothetical protein